VARSEPNCPVDDDDRVWIDNTLQWLRDTLGPQGLSATVVLPTDAFFPGVYRGNADERRALVGRIAEWMNVDPSRVVAGSTRTSDGPPLRQCLPVQAVPFHGHYRTADGRVFVDLDELPEAPVQLVTAIAHELAHDRLPPVAGPVTLDDEETVDLVLVYLGLGVFAANAALGYEKRMQGTHISIRVSHGGVLTEQMYGYALARYARMRREVSPAWATYLDLNPRTYLRRAMRYLDRVESGAVSL
jgi:hypothetical protein